MKSEQMPAFTHIKNKIGEKYLPNALEAIKYAKASEEILKVKKYFESFCVLEKVLDKVVKYETYFDKFYPDSETAIPADEALQYHIHSYISDLIVLRNKLICFFNMLRDDLKEITLVKESVDVAFSVLKENIMKGFNDVSEIRNINHHDAELFLDYNITVSESMRFLLETKHIPLEYDKEKLLSAIAKKQNDSLEMAKKDWIEKANKNSKNILHTTDEIFKRSENYVFTLLSIKE